VEDRNFLWNEARELKIESIRQMTSSSGLEECTFQPKLVSSRVKSRRAMRKEKCPPQENCEHSILSSISVQKYVSRMHKAREVKIKAQEAQDKKPGSGKIWKRRITIPKEPNFRVSRPRSRDSSQKRSCHSLSRMLNKNNISVQNLDLSNYSSNVDYQGGFVQPSAKHP